MTAQDTVLVVAPNWLGDAVMALPAIADIKRHFNGSRLVVAARASVADLFQLVPGVDDVLRITWRGKWFKLGEFRGDAQQMRGAGARLAVLLPNSFASAWLVRRAGIPERWGYASDGRARLLTGAVRRPGGSRHQGAYYQHLIHELGVTNGPLAPVLEVGEEARTAARALLVARGWNGVSPLITLAPGAAYGTAKQWLPEYVIRLVASLTRDGATCVLVGGKADAATTNAIRAALPPECARATIDLAGATTLPELAAVLVLSSACVSNDSGAMHVAAALGTSVVALFGPTIEGQTHPLTAPGGWAKVLTSDVWCRPCMLRECPLDHACMSGITPEAVKDALAEVPSRPASERSVP